MQQVWLSYGLFCHIPPALNWLKDILDYFPSYEFPYDVYTVAVAAVLIYYLDYGDLE